MKWILMAMVLTSIQSPGVRAETGPTPDSRPQIRALLLDEAYRPEQAPAAGQTVWDLAKAAVYRTREARQMLEDARAWSTRIDPRASNHGWEKLDARLARIESAYREQIAPALGELGDRSFISLRGVATDVHLLLQEREFYARYVLPTGSNAAFNGKPKADGIEGLQRWREEAEAHAVVAEERLEKGLAQLRGRGPRAESRFPDYLDDIVAAAEEAMDQAALKSLGLARSQAGLAGKDGAYARAIAAVASFGGKDGQGAFEEASRADAVLLSNEANRLFVINEYTLAGRVEEARTMEYLLARFGKL